MRYIFILALFVSCKLAKPTPPQSVVNRNPASPSLQLAKTITPQYEVESLSEVELSPSFIEVKKEKEGASRYPIFYVVHKEPDFIFPTHYEAEVCIEKECYLEVFPHKILFLPPFISTYSVKVRQCILGAYLVGKKTLCGPWNREIGRAHV